MPTKGANIEFPARETYRLKDKARMATLFICHFYGRSRPAALPPISSFPPGKQFDKKAERERQLFYPSFITGVQDVPSGTPAALPPPQVRPKFRKAEFRAWPEKISSRQRRACTGVGLKPVFCGEQKPGRKRVKRRRSRSEGKTAHSCIKRLQIAKRFFTKQGLF